MSAVTELGYFGIGVRDIGAWKAFAGEVLGLEVVPGENPKSCVLRTDYWFQRILISENGADDIDFMGWRVANEDAFNEMKHRLKNSEIPYEVASEQQAAERHVLGLMTLKDPNGVAIEVFFGPRIEAGLPFYPGRRMHGGFVTGERGVGHVVTNVADPKKCEDFYTKVLGMRGSIEFEIRPPGVPALPMYFMSCNSRQHSFAFANMGGNQKIGHVMLEMTRIEDVGMTRDIVKQRNIPIRLDIGQHHNDHALSFYCATPSGWMWECGWGVIAPAGQAEWGKNGIWGHEFFPPAPAAAGR